MKFKYLDMEEFVNHLSHPTNLCEHRGLCPVYEPDDDRICKWQCMNDLQYCTYKLTEDEE